MFGMRRGERQKLELENARLRRRIQDLENPYPPAKKAKGKK